MITSDYGKSRGVRKGPKCDYVIFECSLTNVQLAFYSIIILFLFVIGPLTPTIHRG